MHSKYANKSRNDDHVFLIDHLLKLNSFNERYTNKRALNLSIV